MLLGKPGLRVFQQESGRGHKKKETTWQEVHTYAWGFIGLSPREYYLLTEYEYLAICKGREIREGVLNNHFRTLGFLIWNLQVEKRDRLKRPSDLWQIPALDEDKDSETEEEKTLNYAQFVQIQDMFKKYDKKKK